MSQPDLASTDKQIRSFLGCFGAMVVASGVLAAFLVPAVLKSRDAAKESQLL